MDPTETADADGDGIGDNADPDDDNDGTPDTTDAFPYDPTEDSDADGDFIGDNADTDDDNDGVSDDLDVWPLDGSQSTDTDGDGIADFLNAITPGESFDFETGGIPSNITTAWSFARCTGGQSTAACVPTTTAHNDWSVTTTDPIAGSYSLMSGQLSSGSMERSLPLSRSTPLAETCHGTGRSAQSREPTTPPGPTDSRSTLTEFKLTLHNTAVA